VSSKKRIAAVAITTVALTVGSVGVSSASSKATKTSSTKKASTVAMKGPRGLDLTATLAALVAKGTITQAQADAIIAAANAAKAAADAAKPMGPKGAFGIDKLAIAATTLGIDSATISTRLKAGESLATIAGAKKDALIAALVAAET
jgi:hypothetical protein